MSSSLSDKEILKALEKGDKDRVDKAMDGLYTTCFPLVKTLILKNSGSEEDAADIFQDSLVIFYLKVRKGEHTYTSTIKTYLWAIARNLWLKKLRKKRLERELETSDFTSDFIEETILQEKQLTIRKALELLDTSCRGLLIDFYFNKRSMSQLKSMYGLGSEEATKNKKYRCLKKFIQLVKKKKLRWSDFEDE